MDDKNAGAKDLFKLILHSPALLVTFLVGLALLVYFLVKHGPSSSTTDQAGNVNGASAPTATVIPQTSIYIPQYATGQNGPGISAPTVLAPSTPVVATPPVSTVPTQGSPVVNGTSVGARLALSYAARAQMGSASNVGIGIRNQPGGSGTQTTSNVAYGQPIQITGPAVTGGYNNPVTPGVANTNQWYPVAGGGYVSAADVTQTNSATQTSTG